MPLPLTVSRFSEIQIDFTFLVLAHPGSPGKRAVKRVYVSMYVSLFTCISAVTYLLSLRINLLFLQARCRKRWL